MIRRIKKEKQAFMGVSKNFGAVDLGMKQTFHLQRKIGFPELNTYNYTAPLHQWKLEMSSQDNCWICNRDIYSVLFWNESIGYLKDQDVVNKEELLHFIS